jgi:hypothetical protein
MPIMLNASMINIICSPNPMARMIGRAANMAKVSTSAPNRPPNREAVNATPSARALAPLGHRKAVEHRRLRGGRAGDAHEHRRERIGGGRRGEQADHHGQGVRGVHVVDEGQQQRQAGDAAEARQDADKQTQRGPEEQERQMLRPHQLREGANKDVQFQDQLPKLPFYRD